MKTSDIIIDLGKYFVLRDTKQACYFVMVNNGTYSFSDSAYPLDDDGYSLAEHRCNYLASSKAAYSTYKSMHPSTY